MNIDIFSFELALCNMYHSHLDEPPFHASINDLIDVVSSHMHEI
jgi:hypothetical protein